MWLGRLQVSSNQGHYAGILITVICAPNSWAMETGLSSTPFFPRAGLNELQLLLNLLNFVQRGTGVGFSRSSTIFGSRDFCCA